MGSVTFHYPHHTGGPNHRFTADDIAGLVGQVTDVVTGEHNHRAVITGADVTEHGLAITIEMTCTCDTCKAQPNTFPLGQVTLPIRPTEPEPDHGPN